MRPLGLALFVCGVVVGAGGVFLWSARASTAQSAPAPSVPAAAVFDPQAQADLAYVKEVRPSQSHTMMDVGY